MDTNDALLLQRFCDGRDAEAFSEIVRLYAGVVYGACKRIIRDRDQAQDVAQDTFFQLFRNTADVTGSLAGWLHTVATRKAIDVVRQDSSRRTRESGYSGNKLGKAQSWDEISPYVDEALGEIDDQLRQVLVKHFLEGLSMRQVAERMDCSQATISRKVDAGLNSLRTILKKRGVIVAVISLSTLMTQNAVQAAPAILMTELGKMSLAAGGTVAAGTIATAKATAATVMTAVKVKVVTAVAIAAIGTGAVVTYNITKEPAVETPVAETVTAANDSAPASNSQTVVPSDNTSQQQWQTFWEEVEAEEKPDEPGTAPVIAEENEEPEPKLQAQQPQETTTPQPARSRRSTTRARGMGGRGSSRAEEPKDEDETPKSYGGGYGGMMGGSSSE
ncbi:MAG: RNA polymerase sigma factor [Planctomycetes bacterium]|nr:RNA polymerase sigma factor [Planctomycetota bacterium]